MHMHVSTCMHSCVHMYMHTYACIPTCTYTRVHTYSVHYTNIAVHTQCAPLHPYTHKQAHASSTHQAPPCACLHTHIYCAHICTHAPPVHIHVSCTHIAAHAHSSMCAHGSHGAHTPAHVHAPHACTLMHRCLTHPPGLQGVFLSPVAGSSSQVSGWVPLGPAAGSPPQGSFRWLSSPLASGCEPTRPCLPRPWGCRPLPHPPL